MPVTLGPPIERPAIFEIVNTAMGEASTDLSKIFHAYAEELSMTEYGRKRVIFENARTKISDLGRIRDNWDSYGAPRLNRDYDATGVQRYKNSPRQRDCFVVSKKKTM